MSYLSEKPGSPGDILEHHGIRGMKWGFREDDDQVDRDAAGRITPMKKAVLSERKQLKVKKFLKNSEVMNTQIADLKVSSEALKGTQNLGTRYKRLSNNEKVRILERKQRRAERDAEAVQKGKLTSTQKKVIVGAVGVGAILAVGGVVAYGRGQQSGAINSMMLRGSARLRGQKIPFNVDKSLAGKMSASDLLNKVAKPVNPGYSTMGGKMNCRRSTYAYELRRRGFDVHATTSALGWGQSESGVINAVTPGSRNFYNHMSMSQSLMGSDVSTVASGDVRKNPITRILVGGLRISPEEESRRVKAAIMAVKPGGDIMEAIRTSGVQSSSMNVLKELGKQPNGARGEVVFKFPNFGHSMAYEVVDGVPHIFDAQKGNLFNTAGKMVESKWDGFSSAEITRLDNVDLDLNFLTRWADNVGGK